MGRSSGLAALGNGTSDPNGGGGSGGEPNGADPNGTDPNGTGQNGALDASTDPGQDASVGDGSDAGQDMVSDAATDSEDAATELAYLDFAGCEHAMAADHTGQANVSISTVGNAYSPPCIRVSAGTVVEWQASVAHPLRSMVNNGDTWAEPMEGLTSNASRTMAEPGSYGYYCSTHANDTPTTGFGDTMKGVVYVEPS